MTDLRKPLAGEQYFVRVAERVEGPYTLAALRSKTVDASVPETAEVRDANSESWRPIKDLFDRMFPSWR